MSSENRPVLSIYMQLHKVRYIRINLSQVVLSTFMKVKLSFRAMEYGFHMITNINLW